MNKTTIYPLPYRERLTIWRDRLVKDLALEADPREHIETVFYDSFDWRLHAAGLCLAAFQQDSKLMLQLLRLDDLTAVAELSVDTLDIRFASQLPDSRLRRLVEPLLEVRAFLPLARLVIRRYPLRQVDAEGKTRVRLSVDNCQLITASGRLRALQKRLRLQPLRGYDKAAGKVRKKLETDYQLAGADDDLYNLALESAGKTPGDYSSKLVVKLDPDMRADAAVRRVLLALLHAMQVNEQGTIQDLDSEFLHDFRVAVRRTRSALGKLKWVFPPATRTRFQREFAWLGAQTSRLRDLDVYLLKFDRYKAAVPKKLRADLEPLRQFLQYKQHQEQAGHLARELQGQRYRRLMQQWRRYLESPLAKRPVAKDAAKPIIIMASRRIWHIYRQVLKEGRAITPESPPPVLHELRKSCKKLRYLMEFFQSLYPGDAIHAAIRELKQLQDDLGDFQDLDVQINAFDHFTLEMRRRGEYSAATAKAMDALLAALKLEMQAVRADFEPRFHRFARSANRERFKKLFHESA